MLATIAVTHSGTASRNDIEPAATDGPATAATAAQPSPTSVL